MLYRFTYANDGPRNPSAGLIAVKRTMYGTTEHGDGDYRCDDYNGCGVIYSVTTAGLFHVLHKFTSGPDGAFPDAALVDLDGTLYGTTLNGGGSKCRHIGCGTIFALAP